MKKHIILAATLAAISSSAHSEVKTITDNGFSVFHIGEVSASPDVMWKRLIAPKEYWSKAHSWSGTTEGFSINPQAGGCFCELIQQKGADGKIKTIGSVEHMRVIFAQPGKVLRMQGALGPLQSEAVLGTLTVAMEPLKDGAGTKVSFSYVVGGYMRYKISEIAPAVDKVIGEQLKSLLSPYMQKTGEEVEVDGFTLDVDKLDLVKPQSDVKPTSEEPAGTAESTEPR
jgi:hypothetical protein